MSMRVLVFIMSLLFSFNAYSGSINEACLISSADVENAQELYSDAKKYLNILEEINIYSFKDIKVPAETIASLVSEKEKLKSSFYEIVEISLRIHNKSSKCAARDWAEILYLIAKSIGYMGDMEHFGLVRSCAMCIIKGFGLKLAYQSLSEKIKDL